MIMSGILVAKLKHSVFRMIFHVIHTRAHAIVASVLTTKVGGRIQEFAKLSKVMKLKNAIMQFLNTPTLYGLIVSRKVKIIFCILLCKSCLKRFMIEW